MIAKVKLQIKINGKNYIVLPGQEIPKEMESFYRENNFIKTLLKNGFAVEAAKSPAKSEGKKDLLG